MMAVVSCREPCMHAPLYCPLHAGHECALAHSSHSSTAMHACVMIPYCSPRMVAAAPSYTPDD